VKDPGDHGDEEHEDIDSCDNPGHALSYVGEAAFDVLHKDHSRSRHELWNVTYGKIIGNLHQTPHLKHSWGSNREPPAGHDDWFPDKMCEIISRTKVWCDITSLSPPDGLFLEKFKEALGNVAQTSKTVPDPIIIRMMFGNIVSMPVDCDAVIRELTSDLDEDANIHLWVGAWRCGVSWNHSKIIAVDGHHLHTGGHNLWDGHYLKNNPVHDISMEAEGPVAVEAHCFAQSQWNFVKHQQRTCVGRIVEKLPDWLEMALETRVTVSEWPEGVADEFPPKFEEGPIMALVSEAPKRPHHCHHVPILSMGRYGDMQRNARASDDAIVAMLNSSRTVIRMALQDLGPITLPGVPGPITVPGCVWPYAYMSALGAAMWERDVVVEIALSNPGSVPGGLKMTEALYGNGWTCVDVAAEIVKTIQEQYTDVRKDELRKTIEKNLHICYIKQNKEGAWEDGLTMGMHAKHFIIDDLAYYIGSQNLYIADLAEWGLVIDNADQCEKVLDEYWRPMWDASWVHTDMPHDHVMAGLQKDRTHKAIKSADKMTRGMTKATLAELSRQAHRAAHRIPQLSAHHRNPDDPDEGDDDIYTDVTDRSPLIGTAGL